MNGSKNLLCSVRIGKREIVCAFGLREWRWTLLSAGRGAYFYLSTIYRGQTTTHEINGEYRNNRRPISLRSPREREKAIKIRINRKIESNKNTKIMDIWRNKRKTIARVEFVWTLSCGQRWTFLYINTEFGGLFVVCVVAKFGIRDTQVRTPNNTQSPLCAWCVSRSESATVGYFSRFYYILSQRHRIGGRIGRVNIGRTPCTSQWAVASTYRIIACTYRMLMDIFNGVQWWKRAFFDNSARPEDISGTRTQPSNSQPLNP